MQITFLCCILHNQNSKKATFSSTPGFFPAALKAACVQLMLPCWKTPVCDSPGHHLCLPFPGSCPEGICNKATPEFELKNWENLLNFFSFNKSLIHECSRQCYSGKGLDGFTNSWSVFCVQLQQVIYKLLYIFFPTIYRYFYLNLSITYLCRKSKKPFLSP